MVLSREAVLGTLCESHICRTQCLWKSPAYTTFTQKWNSRYSLDNVYSSYN